MCGIAPPPGKTLASIKLYVPPVSSLIQQLFFINPFSKLSFPLSVVGFNYLVIGNIVTVIRRKQIVVGEP
jgi:hypothetical protein